MQHAGKIGLIYFAHKCNSILESLGKQFVMVLINCYGPDVEPIQCVKGLHGMEWNWRRSTSY